MVAYSRFKMPVFDKVATSTAEATARQLAKFSFYIVVIVLCSHYFYINVIVRHGVDLVKGFWTIFGDEGGMLHPLFPGAPCSFPVPD